MVPRNSPLRLKSGVTYRALPPPPALLGSTSAVDGLALTGVVGELAETGSTHRDWSFGGAGDRGHGGPIAARWSKTGMGERDSSAHALTYSPLGVTGRSLRSLSYSSRVVHQEGGCFAKLLGRHACVLFFSLFPCIIFAVTFSLLPTVVVTQIRGHICSRLPSPPPPTPPPPS